MSEELCLCVCKNTTQRKHINCSNWETYTHTHAHKLPTCSDDGLTLPSVMRVISSSGAQPTWLAVSPHQQSDMTQPHQVGEGCGSLVPTPHLGWGLGTRLRMWWGEGRSERGSSCKWEMAVYTVLEWCCWKLFCRLNESGCACAVDVKVTEKFSEWKQAHVGMEA